MVNVSFDDFASHFSKTNFLTISKFSNVHYSIIDLYRYDTLLDFLHIFNTHTKKCHTEKTLTPDILAALGEAGVWGLEGGVIGNLRPVSPRCLEAGDPVEGGWEDRLKMSIESIGDGGLSSSVVDIRWVCLPVMASSTYLFRKCCDR